ncbi:MAG: hypothetical protein AAF636_26505 [Pseudomonadota bacterium]
MSFDYFVVGAGTAGCVPANRLSENPFKTVLLLEPSGNARRIVTDMPGVFVLAARRPRLDWGFLSEPNVQSNGRVILRHRSKGFGGPCTDAPEHIDPQT